jgi:acetyl esterase
VTRQLYYLERGRLVEIITWWGGRGPRNVLIRRADGELVVRPFRGLRRPRPVQTAPPGCPDSSAS